MPAFLMAWGRGRWDALRKGGRGAHEVRDSAAGESKRPVASVPLLARPGDWRRLCVMDDPATTCKCTSDPHKHHVSDSSKVKTVKPIDERHLWPKERPWQFTIGEHSLFAEFKGLKCGCRVNSLWQTSFPLTVGSP